MASGTITLSSTQMMRGQVQWWSESDISSNSSTVTAVTQVRKSSSYSGTTGTFSGYTEIGGSGESGTYYGLVEGDWVEVSRTTRTVAHDSLGNGSVNIAGQVKGPSGTSLAGHTCSGSATVTLDKIPRGVSLVAAQNFNDEENPVITYSNPAGNGADSLKAGIFSEDGSTAYAAYREISKTGESYTFSLTDAERNALRNAIPNASSMRVSFRLVGTFGTTTMDSEITKEFFVTNANPTVSGTVTEKNTDISALVGSSGRMIRYISNAEVSMTASALKGATIQKQTITCGSKTITGASGTFTGIESGDFVFTVIDSRGNRTSQTITKNLAYYLIPTISIGSNVPDTSGNFTLSLSGQFYNGGFGSETNTIKVEYRYKTGTGSYGSWTKLTHVLDGNSFTASKVFSGLDYRTTYTFQARITDSLKTVTTAETPIRSTPVFGWKEDLFRVFEDLEVAGDTRMEGNASVEGNVTVTGTLSVGGSQIGGYEVGDIFISTSATSPAARFGGTWERIYDKFLWATNEAGVGTKAGSQNVTLGTKHLPSHIHYYTGTNVLSSTGSDFGRIAIGSRSAAESCDAPTRSDNCGGESFSIMPPYLGVRMWQRIA